MVRWIGFHLSWENEPDFAGTKSLFLYNPHFAYCNRIQSGEGEGTEPDSAGIKSRALYNPHFANSVQIQSGEGEGTEPDSAGIKSRALYNPHFANSVQIQSGVAERGFFDIIKVLDEKERKRAWESRLK